MQRYFVEDVFEENQFTLSGDDAKHIAKVMRMQAGDEIIVVHSHVADQCKIVKLGDQTVTVEKTGHQIPSKELPIHVTIACGLPKGDKLDLIVQKATELGMTKLIPFEAARSIVKWDYKKGEKKQQRLQKIAKEAAEQSHRSVVPTIDAPLSFKQLLALASTYDAVLLADEEHAKSEQRTSLKERLKGLQGLQNVCVVFGPEGGIAREEAAALVKAGAHTIALGPRILRAETAPFYILSAISYEFE